MYVIPYDRLPPGFGERLEQTPREPAPALPAATVVLLRNGDHGPEVLLLKRHRSSGFVPGAYVFPGGRVDAADAAPALASYVADLPEELDPPLSFWTAALREVFEETGVLLAQADGDASERTHLRERLLADDATVQDVLASLHARVHLEKLVYCAHWITPLAEPRRFDTRFFAAQLPDGADVIPDAREMDAARWLTPAAALQEFQRGSLPMVFPTVKTIERLCGFESVEHILAVLRGEAVIPLLPRLVRTAEGIGITVDP